MLGAHRYLAAAIVAASVGVVTPACAPYGSTYRDSAHVRLDVDRLAFENGHRKGLEQGRRDGLDRRSYSYERHPEFRNAEQGYRRSYGDRRVYQQQYRVGFERGYAEGFRQDTGRRAGRGR